MSPSTPASTSRPGRSRPLPPLSPLTRRRLRNFRKNRRGFWSLWIFLVLFALSLGAELVANDRPLLVRYDGAFYVPALVAYPESSFGGTFLHDTINYDLPVPAPAPPSRVNWLGTDDQGRDVAARLIYGFRTSVLFGLALTLASSVIGIAAGAVQGYFGGWPDL